jgi:predicted small lipoprotein YifL
MIKTGKTRLAAVMVAALLVALSGCEKKEGPVEQAGKKVDQATEKAGEQIEKAGDKLQDAAQGDKK